mgnify:CR=1 FL=1
MAKVELKQPIVDQIAEEIKDAQSVVLVDHRGLTVAQDTELRKQLREAGVVYKVYKNTLMARAFNDMNIDLNEYLNGSSALAFGSDAVAPVKVLADFAKKHDALALKVGIVEGEVSDKAKLEELATIPSREGLLTMLAAGMMGIPKDLSICLDLYAKQKEEEK